MFDSTTRLFEYKTAVPESTCVNSSLNCILHMMDLQNSNTALIIHGFTLRTTNIQVVVSNTDYSRYLLDVYWILYFNFSEFILKAILILKLQILMYYIT